MPKTNRHFWRLKIRRNRERDGEVDLALKKLGWKTIRVWEHDIKKSVNRVVEKLLNLASPRSLVERTRLTSPRNIRAKYEK